MFNKGRDNDEANRKRKNGAVFERLWRDTLNSINVDDSKLKNNGTWNKIRNSKSNINRNNSIINQVKERQKNGSPGFHNIKKFANPKQKLDLCFKRHEESHFPVETSRCACTMANGNFSQTLLRNKSLIEIGKSSCKGHLDESDHLWESCDGNFTYQMHSRNKNVQSNHELPLKSFCKYALRSDDALDEHCCDFDQAQFSEEENFSHHQYRILPATGNKLCYKYSSGVISKNVNKNQDPLKKSSEKCVRSKSKLFAKDNPSTTIVDARQLIVASRSAKVSYRSASNCKCTCQCDVLRYR